MDTYAGALFLGDPKFIHRKVQADPVPEEEGVDAGKKSPEERDPLASTEEEDPESLIVRIDLKEIDRLYYHVRAIENDCHIIPQGSMRLNENHEVQRNEAFCGLNKDECFDLKYYSHFRNVQNEAKLQSLEADDAIFQRNFLDDCSSDKPTGSWSL